MSGWSVMNDIWNLFFIFGRPNIDRAVIYFTYFLMLEAAI